MIRTTKTFIFVMNRVKYANQNKDMPAMITIIEDDSTIREGMSYLLQKKGNFIISGEYGSFDEARTNLQNESPDVILLDIELPGTNGIDAIAEIKKMLPLVHVIMLTVYENEKTIFTALANGASGYLVKSNNSSKIIEAVNEVMQGGGPMSAGIARLVIQSFQKNTNSPLSKRETEVLQGISEGKSRGKISKELFIDIETVKTHIKSIYHKLNVNSRDEALKVARDSKYI
jgi:DNA-binding NarL/FixJ family response regulator